MGEATSTRSIERIRAVRGTVPDTWVTPSQHALLGLLLGTRGTTGLATRALRDDARLWEAYWRDELSLDDTVRVGPRVATVGRLLAASLLPERVRPEPLAEPWTAPRVQRWLREVARVAHVEVAARCSTALEALGAAWLGRSGASPCIDDLRAPPTKWATIAAARARVAGVEAEYVDGLITDGERYNRNVDCWSALTEEVVRAALETSDGSVFDVMARSSRGGRTQVHRRMRAMVGIVAKSSGEIVERPVLHSSGEGLDAHEGFLLAVSSRAGELGERRRLGEIDALFEELCAALGPWTVTSLDCGDDVGETLSEPFDPYELRAPLYDRVEGRRLTRDVVNFDGDVVARRGEVVGHAHRARWIGVREASVRSVSTCRETDGVCARCYGRDPDDGGAVHVGERVGLRAAWALASVVARLPARWTVWIQIGGERAPDRCRRAGRGGRVRFADDLFAKGRALRLGVIEVVGDDGARDASLVNEGDVLSVGNGERVLAGTPLVTFDVLYERPRIVAIPEGVKARVELPPDAAPGALVELPDERTGCCAWFVAASGDLDLTLRAIDDPTRVWTMHVEAGGRLDASIGAVVERGDIIATKIAHRPYWEHVQEGLSELRSKLDLEDVPWRGSLEQLARFDGVVTEVIRNRAFVVTGARGQTQRVSTQHTWARREGDVVRAGDVLVDGGENVPQRLRIFGEAYVAERLIGRLESHAAWGGLHAPRVHWELIARAMLAWRRVRRPGDTGMLRNKVYSLAECGRIQRETAARGGAPAELVTVIRGIGRMAGRRWRLSRRDRMEARADYERECRRPRSRT